MSTWQERLKKAAEAATDVVGEAAKAVEGAARDAGAQYKAYQEAQQTKITLLPDEDPCGVAAREAAAADATAMFPDHDVAWTVGETVLNERPSMRLVGVRVTPDGEIGHAAVMLAYQCTAAAPVRVGAYVPGEGGWTLHSAVGEESALPPRLTP